MNPRERVLAALSFQPVDKIPLQIHPSPGGLHEHGQKLLDLMRPPIVRHTSRRVAA